MVEPLLLAVGVVVASMVGRALLSRESVRKRESDDAWSEACRVLQGTHFAHRSFVETSVRTVRFSCGDAYVTLFEREDTAGRSRTVSTHCEVYGLPSVDGVKLTVRKTLLPNLDAHTDFERQFVAKATPAILATIFLDPRTGELVCDAEQPFEIEHGMIRIRTDGQAERSEPLVALGHYGRALCERWLAMEQAPRLLAADLGFEPNPEPLRFEGTTVLGQSYRRGRTWQIEFACSAGCEIVLRTLEEPHVELRFDALGSSAEEIAQALEAKESELGTASAYR